MKGIQQGREQHNLFSKEMRLSSKGKMNSLGDGFIPPREKASERATHPRGRFISPRENDAGRFKECSSRNRDFSPRGKFTPPHDKVVRKVTEGKFPRGGSRDRVVPLSKRFYQRIESILQRVDSFPQERRLQTTSLLQGRRQRKDMFLQSYMFF